jgi:hypothetical protein
MEDNKYILSKNAIGIMLLWLGPPLFYFIRTQFHLGGGSITSGFFYLLSLLLLRSPLDVKLGFRPNNILLALGGSFYVLALLYFGVHNFNTFSRVTDTINIIVTILFFFLLLRIDNQVQRYLPFWGIVITLIVNIVLIYSVINNPNYVIGARATVQMGESDFSGNPGIYARNGLYGVIISMLFVYKKELNLYKQNSIFAYILSITNLLISLICIIISQTRMILLSFLIVVVIFILFIKKNHLTHIKNKIAFKIVNIGFVGIAVFLNFKFHLLQLLQSYFFMFWGTFEKAILTALTLGKSTSREADESAMGRVRSIDFFKNHLAHEKFNLIFGNGFNFRYLDVPILEAFLNFGIIGIILYLSFLISVGYFAFKALASKEIFQNFLGLIYIQFILSLVSAGRPLDLAHCVTYFIFIRFLNIKYKKTSLINE